MKTILAAFLILAFAPLAVRADDVAEITIRVAKEKKPFKKIVIALYEQDAPQTVANFEKLARHGFYKGVKVHRVFPKMLVQMGDPLSKKSDRRQVGTGGPGYTLPPEIHRKHTLGAVAMTRLPDAINPGRRSNGSQFYICLQAMPNLDGQYTVFGEVISGMDALQEISQLPADTNDNPLELVRILSVKIKPRGT